MTHEDRFREWFKTLPPSERADLEKAGAGLSSIKDPPIGGMREFDEQMLESDLPHAGAKEIQKAIQEMSAHAQDDDPGHDPILMAHLIRIIHFFMEIMDSHQPNDLASTHAMVAKIVLGIGDPPPQREIARRYGIPRSTINKRVKALQDRLGLKPSRFMHHEGHCQAFSLGHVMSQIIRETNPKKEEEDFRDPGS